MPDWRALLLDLLGAGASAENVLALQLWADSEATPAWANNPLGATADMPGSRPLSENPAGLRAYPDLATFARAMAAQLGVDLRYRPIIEALRDEASLELVWRAINASPWCEGCQAGRYPAALANWILGARSPAEGYPAGQVAPPPRSISEAPIDASRPARELGRELGQAARELGDVDRALGSLLRRL